MAGTGEPEAAQERESRGGAGTGKPGAVLPGGGAVGGKKNKGKHRFVQAFFNPAYRR